MKIFNASLKDGQVYIGDTPVPDATVLSQGAGNSSGILLLAENQCIYIAQISDDIKSALTLLADAFTKLSTDVKVATGGTSDVGGATPTFQKDMQQVAQKLNDLAGGLK